MSFLIKKSKTTQEVPTLNPELDGDIMNLNREMQEGLTELHETMCILMTKFSCILLDSYVDMDKTIKSQEDALERCKKDAEEGCLCKEENEELLKDNKELTGIVSEIREQMDKCQKSYQKLNEESTARYESDQKFVREQFIEIELLKSDLENKAKDTAQYKLLLAESREVSQNAAKQLDIKSKEIQTIFEECQANKKNLKRIESTYSAYVLTLTERLDHAQIELSIASVALNNVRDSTKSEGSCSSEIEICLSEDSIKERNSKSLIVEKTSRENDEVKNMADAVQIKSEVSESNIVSQYVHPSPKAKCIFDELRKKREKKESQRTFEMKTKDLEILRLESALVKAIEKTAEMEQGVSQIVKISEEMKMLTKEFENERNQVRELRGENISLNSALEKSREDCEIISDEFEKYRNKSDITILELQQSNDASILETLKEEHDLAFAKAQSKFQAVSKKFDDYKRISQIQILELQANQNRLQDLLDKATAKSLFLRESLELKSRTASSVSSEVESVVEKEADFTIQELAAEMQKLKNQLAKAKSKNRRLSTELERSQRETQESEAYLKSYEDTIGRAFQDIRQRNNYLQHLLETKNDHIFQLKNTVRALSHNLEMNTTREFDSITFDLRTAQQHRDVDDIFDETDRSRSSVSPNYDFQLDEVVMALHDEENGVYAKAKVFYVEEDVYGVQFEDRDMGKLVPCTQMRKFRTDDLTSVSAEESAEQ